MNNIISSWKKVNHKLFLALLVMGLCPTIYTTLRVFFMGSFPSEWSYSIAAQMEWVNLLYEIVNEAIILPLFFFIGKVINDEKELNNRIRTGLICTVAIYTVVSLVIIIFARPMLGFMKASRDFLEESVTYIRIESVANIFMVMYEFALVVLVSIGKDKYVYITTAVKMLLSIATDTFLVSSLPCSANLGVNGIGYSNIIVNMLLFACIMFIASKEGIKLIGDKTIGSDKLDFTWMKEFVKIGGISGIESFVRNIAYMMMISRMVNFVGESGTYWVANNFIWGWLLLPVTQLATLIKQEIATDKNAIKDKTKGYFFITAIICIAWIVSIPVWKPFMANILGYNDVDKLFSLVMILLGFYILYALQNIYDATFYGLGKTNYMLFESIVTNSVYYGIAFILYLTGIWVPTLTGIALLFGIGMAFDSIVSLGAYMYLRKRI